MLQNRPLEALNQIFLSCQYNYGEIIRGRAL
jgi:hypothetical protein